MRFGLPIASYRLPSPRASSARLLNCFVEQAPKDGQKGPVTLRRSPGISSWIEVGGGPIRGFTFMGNLLYAVSGEELYSINNAGTATLVTGTVSGSERVRISNNGFDIVIVRPTDNSAYESDGSTVTQILDPVFTGWGAADVDFLDGYFVFRRPNSQQFFNSGLNAVTFNALDIASAEGAPDNLVALIVDHRELFLPGVTSSELFYNNGQSPGSPFARTPNGFMELGCAASYSPGKSDNSVMLLASDKTVRRLQGNNLIRISQHGVESVIERMGTISDAFSLTYTQDGHVCYALTFPFAGRTFVFDVTSGEWHERESLGYGAWRANCLIRAHGRQLVGDSQSGRIGILDPDVFEEWGEPQQCSWQYQGIYGDNNRVSHRRFEIVLNVGHGVTVGQGAIPLATLKMSDDGGETFRTLPTRSLGEIGKYEKRAVWWNLGSSKDRVYRVDVTDPVPLFVVDTQIEAQGLRH